MEEKCDVGKLGNDDSCHKLSYTRKTGLKDFHLLSEEEQDVVLWRASLRDHKDSVHRICLHHEQCYLVRFPINFQHCCDPFEKHAKTYKKTKGQVLVTLEMALQLESKHKLVVPGWKICRTCQKQFQELIEASEEDTSSQEEADISDCEQAIKFDVEAKRHKLDESLSSLGVSPVRLKGVKQSQWENYVEKKTDQVRTALQDKFTNVLGTAVSPTILNKTNSSFRKLTTSIA